MLRSGSARGQELKIQARLLAVTAPRHVTAAQGGRNFDATIQPNSRTTLATQRHFSSNCKFRGM